MTQQTSGQRFSVAIVSMVAFGLALPGWSLAYEPNQSTGTGTHQGEDASISTKRGGNTSPNTGRNEHSGSATGAVRDPKNPEPEADRHKGSHQLGSQSSHEGKTGDNEGRGKAGARTDK
jgi:hypothetical protein